MQVRMIILTLQIHFKNIKLDNIFQYVYPESDNKVVFSIVLMMKLEFTPL